MNSGLAVEGGVDMPNPGQPTISAGATGGAVRRLQRALRRTPNLGLVVDGVFGPATEAAVKEFQQGKKASKVGTLSSCMSFE